MVTVFTTTWAAAATSGPPLNTIIQVLGAAISAATIQKSSGMSEIKTTDLPLDALKINQGALNSSALSRSTISHSSLQTLKNQHVNLVIQIGLYRDHYSIFARGDLV
jgi:hypothetical protein